MKIMSTKKAINLLNNRKFHGVNTPDTSNKQKMNGVVHQMERKENLKKENHVQE